MKRIDRLLREMNLTRDAICYKYKKKNGEVWFVPTFNPLWWLITTIAIVGAACWIYAIATLIILLAP